MKTPVHGQQETTPVEVITRQHCYTGSLVTRGYRVAEVLSDPNTDILEMRQTVVGAVGVRSTDIRCRQMFLKKDGILLVIPKGDHEAPTRRLNNYVEKDRYGAIIVLPGYILWGLLHLPPHAVPSTLLAENSTLPSFIGVTDVTVHSSIGGSAVLRCKVAILGRQFIESVQLAARPLPKPEGKTEEESTTRDQGQDRASVQCG